jgi:tetratricopeptide (TPR) repeat protein
MIVRNEAGRVSRALTSVRNAVDTWLVIDTGSADATIEEIHSATAGWQGTLLKRPWVSFGENRTELVQLARELKVAKWLMTIDADHVVEDANLISASVNEAQKRGIDALLIPFTDVPTMWTIRLIRTDMSWSYVGVTREYITCADPFACGKVHMPRIRDFADGASRANKYRRDVEMLREELSAAPENARSWFCLGDSYRGLHQHELAAVAYTNCAVKSQWDEERYVAITLSGEMLLAQGKTEEGLARLLQANQERPRRREALLMACQVLNKMGRHREVLTLLDGKSIRRPIPPQDILAIVPDAYGQAMALERTIAEAALPRSNR